MKPVIGITTARTPNKYGWNYHVTYEPNVEAIKRAGGIPILLPVGLPYDDFRALYERVDGLMLPGGGDISPDFYGVDEQHPLTDEIDRPRDETELEAVRWAVDDDLPLLGICRGHQVVNVALGGTLLQDIPSLVDTDQPHDFPREEPRSQLAHTLVAAKGSKLAQIVGEVPFDVNSLHHQAVAIPGHGLVVTSLNSDGVIEATEHPTKAFVLSVQWHPEDINTPHSTSEKLFAAFVAAACQRTGS